MASHGRAKAPDRTGSTADLNLRPGLRAVVTTASLVGAFSLCLTAADTTFAAPLRPADAPESLGAASSCDISSSATPQTTQRVEVQPNTVAPATEAVVETPPIPAEEAFTRLSLDLSAPRVLAGQLGASGGFALHAPSQPHTRISRWRSRAEAFVPDWQTPVVRDLSLFVANDDEALSWSFSHASPNYGRVSYQEDRVEIGKLAAGVSVALDDMQLALAYVAREEPSQLGYTAHEDYAGLIWTFRR